MGGLKTKYIRFYSVLPTMTKKEFNWIEYYNNHRNSKPTSTLLKGLKYFNDNGLQIHKKSIDIGCGQGDFLTQAKELGINAEGIDDKDFWISRIVEFFISFC